jgi:hypothetical protein
MTEKEQELIDEIMDHFNFDKVAKVMTFLEWKWISAEDGIPSVGEIRQSARRLLKDAIKNKTTIGTGGFRAIYDDGYLHLEFILTEFDSSID